MKIVQKFGGTSLKDAEHICLAAQRVKDRFENGENHLAVVVSAMDDQTDRLASLYRSISDERDDCYDMILASGEQVSTALLTAALRAKGIPARGFCSWQLPIITDDYHSQARPREIHTHKIEDVWNNERGVAVVTGFQGVTEDNRITTLGRGCSDSTAVAIAVALEADVCEIYTDVEGVYSADPRIVPTARKHDAITYEDMLEMSSSGCKVLHPRASVFAMKYEMPIIIRSSLTNDEGTMITSKNHLPKKSGVADLTPVTDATAVTHRTDVAKITLTKIADKPNVAASIFETLAVENISVDMIVQNIATETKKTDITFTIDKKDVKKTIQLFNAKKRVLGFDQLLCDEQLAQCSVVGVGMQDNAGAAARMFQTLAQHKINIEAISTSDFKIGVLIKKSSLQEALQALHDAFKLS